MDVIERLAAADIGFFVTGSEAMAVLGMAYRATNDIDLVLDLDPAAYEHRLRPAFSPITSLRPFSTSAAAGWAARSGVAATSTRRTS